MFFWFSNKWNWYNFLFINKHETKSKHELIPAIIAFVYEKFDAAYFI